MTRILKMEKNLLVLPNIMIALFYTWPQVIEAFLQSF